MQNLIYYLRGWRRTMKISFISEFLTFQGSLKTLAPHVWCICRLTKEILEVTSSTNPLIIADEKNRKTSLFLNVQQNVHNLKTREITSNMCFLKNSSFSLVKGLNAIYHKKITWNSWKKVEEEEKFKGPNKRLFSYVVQLACTNASDLFFGGKTTLARFLQIDCQLVAIKLVVLHKNRN